MSQINVEFYDLPDGSYPAEAFLELLDNNMQAKMMRTVDLLERNTKEYLSR